ncbi:hemerythrin domain-containing protein [Neptuniibacter halophilus]|uniref:hemerythrin domain-containing protein n=1 Tax=Neptuniibacter halophilus TaxID=651666 RepID=UPI00257259A9|nr:hemerythrin domain-containing protein [Neptuniibacter halophilus]
MPQQNNQTPTTHAEPLLEFSNCHQGIIEHLERLRTLSETPPGSPLTPEKRKAAAEIQQFFHGVILAHHQEEEEELFSEVKDSARCRSPEALQALDMINQLTAEHRLLEAQWKPLEKQLKQIARGRSDRLNPEASRKLVEDYLAHALFEEQQFLPLAARLLGDKGLSSLGLSLHMRHNPLKLPTYI